MTVDSIRRTSGERYTVTVDGEDIPSTLGAVTDMLLFEGKTIDGEQLEKLKLLSVRSLGREEALNIVSRRQMSSGELKKKMREKGYSDDVAGYCAGWLEDNGFLNDLRYAEAVVRHYWAKGYGAGRIKSEFIKRYIDRDLWDEALEEINEDSSAIDRLVASKLKGSTDREQIARVSNMLYRRGYSWDEIRQAVSRAGARDDFEP